MRRTPNPWVAVPAFLMGVLAAVLGWVMTDLSCEATPSVRDGCPGWSALIAVASFLLVTVGVAVILALVYRSLAEWREGEDSRS